MVLLDLRLNVKVVQRLDSRRLSLGTVIYNPHDNAFTGAPGLGASITATTG